METWSTFYRPLDNWHPNLVVSETAGACKGVPYLDLELGLRRDNSVTFDLYRKPMNLYQYLPRGSCHRHSVFQCLVRGEARCILKRCPDAEDADKHLSFFHLQLVKRGCRTHEIVHQFHSAKHRHAHPNVVRGPEVRKCFPKVKHDSSVNYAKLHEFIHLHSHMLKYQPKFVCATTTQKSIFRMLYPYMWRNQARGGRDGSLC